MDHRAMAEHAVEMGAFKAEVIGLENFTFDPAFREMCKANLCGNYGLCWTCPPDVGDISQLIAEAKTYNWGLVYQTVNKLEDSYDFEGMMEAGCIISWPRKLQTGRRGRTSPAGSSWARADVTFVRPARSKRAMPPP